MSEKYASASSGPSPARRDRSAQELLASLSLGTGKAAPSATLSPDSIAKWDKSFEANPKHRLAQTVLCKADFTQALTSRKAVIDNPHMFNTKLSSEVGPVTNQKSSGRCWLFATTNVLRVPFARRLGLEEFQFSQSYLFFYDSLAKANWFLEQMLDLAETPLDDRTVQYLFQMPENDGGQWDMAVNLLEEYGLVPQSIFPESFTSSATGKIDGLLTSKLREYALELRELHATAMRSLADVQGKGIEAKREIAVQSARKRKEELMEEVYTILAISCGTPPKPDDEFTWEYLTEDKQFRSITTTPRKFYKEHVKVDASRAISLVHDPRTPMNKLVTVSRLGNVTGARPVLYVNTEIEGLKDAAIKLLKQDVPVWFGCDVGKSSSTALGLMVHDLYDLENTFNTGLTMTKEQRLRTGDSAMTHAMVLSAVHLDDSGLPVRWRVENSWGSDAGDKGWFCMSDEWFSEFVFQIVVDRALVPKKLRDVFEGEVDIVLPPWVSGHFPGRSFASSVLADQLPFLLQDPMGSLA